MTIFTAGGDFSNALSWTPQSIPGASDTIDGVFLTLVGAGVIDTLIAEYSAGHGGVTIGGPLTSNTATLLAQTSSGLDGTWINTGALVVNGLLGVSGSGVYAGALITENTSVTLNGVIDVSGAHASWLASGTTVSGTGDIVADTNATVTLDHVAINGLTADTGSAVNIKNDASITGTGSSVYRAIVRGGASLQVFGPLSVDKAGLLVTDAGSALNAATLTLSASADSTLFVQSGARLFDIAAMLGEGSGTNSAATVQGGTWNNSAYLRVGDNGRGGLGVSFGGEVDDSFGYLGYASTGLGTAGVSNGGYWQNTTALNVGFYGNGSLTVGGGGTVDGAHLSIAAIPGSSGTVTVAGTGALLRATNLDLNGATATMTIGAGGTVIASTVNNSGTIVTQDGGTLQTDPMTIAAGGVLIGNGGTVTGAVTDNGSIVAAQDSLGNSGVLDITSAITGTGSLTMSNFGELIFGDAVASSLSSAFTGRAETLALYAPLSFGPTIGGYASSDTVAVPAIGGQGAPVYATVGGNTTVSYANGISLTFAGAFAPGSIHIVACYAEGTRLRTDYGDIEVERLRVGDLLETISGAMRSIIWIGRRRVDCRRHASPPSVQPVHVAAGAVAANIPCRDLLLSPDHAVFLENTLIPIKRMVNGVTIRQLDRDTVDYFHVELDRHDVVYAEGLPAESYLDTGNRDTFSAAGAARTHGLVGRHATLIREAFACAPFALAGSAVDAARWRCGTTTGETSGGEKELHSQEV